MRYAGWTITRWPAGLVLRPPAGRALGPFSDFGAVLDALGPSTPAEELVAEAAYHALVRPWPEPGVPRPRAYISAPAGAAPLLAQALARLAWDDGYWPVAPSLYAPQWLDLRHPREALALTTWMRTLLPGCRALYTLSGWTPDADGAPEWAEALRLSLPRRRVTPRELADAQAALPFAADAFRLLPVTPEPD
jgi:hypothetical protein